MSIVGAARIDRIYEAKLRENYVKLVKEPPPEGAEACVRKLEEFVEKNVPEKSRVQCDVCAGWSDENLSSCPYCNDEGPPENVPAPKESGVIEVAAEVVTEPETAIDATVIEASGVKLEEEPKKGPKGSKKKSAAEIAETKAPKPMPAVPIPSAPVMDVPLAPVVANETELDAALERYHKAGQVYGVGSYMMAIEIAKIHDHLWQQRLEGGKAKYKSWAQFVDTELKISVSYANRLRAVAAKFSKKECEAYGPKMLMVIAAAPKADHAQLLAKAEEGATTRELDAEVRKIREAKGISVVDDDEPKEGGAAKGRAQTQKASEAAKAAKAAKAAARANKESAAITIGLKSEAGKVKLFAKPLDEKLPHQKADRAKTIEDQPYGKIEGINGVTLFLAIVRSPTGDLEIRYTAKREDDEE